jgi:hypothetical protein
MESDRLNLVYVPLAGKKPRRKSGRPAGPDGQYALASKDGIQLLTNVVRRLKPQVLLRGINTGMPRWAYEQIKEASPKTLTIVADGNNPHKVSKHAARYKDMVDMFLINSRDPNTMGQYRKAGFQVGTMYDGFSPGDHQPNPKQPRMDCFFGGSNRRRKVADPDPGKTRCLWRWDFPGGEFRFRFISLVRERFRLLLHGPAREWPFDAKPILYWPNYFGAFQRAKLSLGCNHYDLHQYYTRRVIHSGASGRMFITKYIPGMEADFGGDGENMAWFMKEEEGVELVKRYVKHEKDRVAVGARCRKLFLEKHTWLARLREFERIVEGVM